AMLVAWRSEVQPDPDALDEAGPPARDRLLTLVPSS
ncbi:WhiB family transcriptional regulator, partial [Micromonospora sp. AMSO31t]